MCLQFGKCETWGASAMEVVVKSQEFWFRAWYSPNDGTLHVTRSGHLTKKGVIKAAESQFGFTWRSMYRNGLKESRHAVIRAIRCSVDLSKKETSFKAKK